MRALSKDLQEFIRLVKAKNVEYLIVGAYALGFHGRPRYTGTGRLGEQEVWFINRELLIHNKRSSNRDKDLADVRLLEQTRPGKRS